MWQQWERWTTNKSVAKIEDTILYDEGKQRIG